MSIKDLAGLEKKIGYHFSRTDNLSAALTHSSTGKDLNYERLEFLGDRVLGLIVSEILFEKFPAEREGDLAKRLAAMVQGTMLAKIALEIDLGLHIDFSEAEHAAGGFKNENILADVMEAVIGAIYLDEGLSSCRQVIESLWDKHFDRTVAPPQHPKTALQEWAQGKALPLPIYRIAQQYGPDHAPVFEVSLKIDGYDEVLAQGRSRQLAEKAAAALFLEKLGQKT